MSPAIPAKRPPTIMEMARRRGPFGIAAAREVETTMPVKAPTDIKPACPKESSPKMPTVRFKEIAMTM